MRAILILLVLFAAWIRPAWADDKPVLAPAPDWVKPTAIPIVPEATDDAPAKVLLLDEQISFERGRISVYSNVAIRIQNGQGLGAGNISLPWRPELDVLTVHKLLIHRGEETIDVLAAGQAFTVMRRESNLEIAMLDGMLTATIQPEGLRVGDTLDVAYTLSTSDPTFQGHVEQMTGMWNATPVARANFRAQWPSDLKVRLRSVELPPIKKTSQNGLTMVELTMDDLEPVPPPKGAPIRYSLMRLIELSDFASWSEVSALMAPLYHKAARIPAEGPLRSELERIRAASTDPKARAEAALALVQERVRYVALLMGVGGLVPADAETSWSRRFGDCKGKTALLLALLHELGIEAEPVLVSTRAGDGMDERLPMVGMFDHVIVRARIAGRTYWLDGTRSGDTDIDRLKVPAWRWGLPVLGSKAELVRMIPPPLTEPEDEMRIHIDASAGISIPAPFKVESIDRGDGAYAYSQMLNGLSADQRERVLRDYWRARFDFVEVKSVTSRFDGKTGELHLAMEGMADMDWNDGWYETDFTGVGYRADFSRHPGPFSDAPFEVSYPFYSRSIETIRLPRGFEKMKPTDKSDVNTTVAGIEYRRHVSFADNVFTVERTARSIAPEFPFKEAAAAEKTLRELAENRVFIRRPSGYVQTATEREALIASEPQSVDDLLERAWMLIDAGRHDEAIKDLDKALEKDPDNGSALANRGLAYIWKNDFDTGTRDLEAAEAIDPEHPVIFRARGVMAERQGKFQEAIDAYTRSLKLDEQSAFAHGRRAFAYYVLGEHEKVLADTTAAIESSPNWVEPYTLKAGALRLQGRHAEAAEVAVALERANPDNDYALTSAANIYSSLRKDEEAMRAFDRALAVKQAAYIYLNRSARRPRGDLAARLADVDEALKLEPKNEDALATRAALLNEKGDHDAAIGIYSDMLKAKAGHPVHLLNRGIAYARKGDMALAERDFEAARAATNVAPFLNNMCWSKATAGVALESALADCDAALAKAPDQPAFLDSRAFVLLRMGRLDEAIALYDQALAKAPRQAASLYGRAIAWSRKGDKNKSQADAEAAVKVSPDVQSQFESYGLGL